MSRCNTENSPPTQHDFDLAGAWMEEWRVSLELTAAGIIMSPRIRIMGVRETVLTLPKTEWEFGRALAAVAPFAKREMAQAFVLSAQDADTFVTWLLEPGSARGLLSGFGWAPRFHVETCELSHPDDVPPIARRIGRLLRQNQRELSAEDDARAELVFGRSGEWPAREIISSTVMTEGTA